MVEYVAGFLFSEKRTQILLIHKLRPEWQKGLMNGIGGHIEKGEAPVDAMHREFEEETGLTGLKWYRFVVVHSPQWRVHFFRAFDEKIWEASTKTDEQLKVVRVKEITHLGIVKTIENLSWLIPLALDESVVHGVVDAKLPGEG